MRWQRWAVGLAVALGSILLGCLIGYSLSDVPEPPGVVVEQAFCAHTATGGMGNVCLYVILDDGELWCWRKRTSGMEEVNELDYTLSRLFYSVLGGLLGLLAFLLWEKARRTRETAG
jgi:hypothetical protein